MAVETQTRSRLLLLDNTEDVREWDALVAASPYCDTYYRSQYVAAYQERNIKAGGLLLRTDSRRYLLPLLIRPVSELPFASESRVFDALTPYGYGGIMPLEFGDLHSAEAATLVAALQKWCREEGVVSVFLRLHSLEDQHLWFHNLDLNGVKLHYSGPTKTVELDPWDDKDALPTSLVAMRSEKIRYRRKLSLQLYTCDDPASIEAVRQFRAIYNETMDRLGANTFYYFSESYFAQLARGLGSDMAIVVARKDDTPVGASVFFAGKKYAHYHLSGSTDLGRKLHATGVIILKGAEWAKSRGCKRLHLGGGVTPNDSLFQFKETFGGRTFQFYSLRVIGDREAYQDLVERRVRATGEIRPNFFPEYRA